MSEWLGAAPAPDNGIGLDAIVPLSGQVQTPLGDFLAASAGEGFWTTAAGQGQTQARRLDAAREAEAAGQQPIDEPTWRSGPHFREGLSFRPGSSTTEARINAEIHDETQARRALIAGRGGGIGNTLLGFAAGIVGSLPTPENFIPIAGPIIEVARAGKLGAMFARAAEATNAMRAGGAGSRALAGAGMGALEGGVGSLGVMPFTIPSRGSFGDDVTAADAVLDVLFGSLAGGVVGGGAGAAFGRRGGTAAPAEAPGPVPTPEATDAGLRALSLAADQMERGQPIDLSLLPPGARLELEKTQAELARLRAMLGPGAAGPGAGKAATVAGRTILGGGDAVPGGSGMATTPTGTAVAVQYEVVDMADLVPSHRADFSEHAGFPAELQPRDRSQREYQDQVAKIASELRPEEVAASPLATTGAPIVRPDGVVLAGNGRVLAIQRAYAEGLPTAEAYRAYLARQGFDVAQMQQPVLVRRTAALDAATERKITRESNSDQVAQRTTAEIAAGDAERLNPQILALLRGPNLASEANAPFVRALVEALPQNERTAISTDGALTTEGVARMNRAVAARAYGDRDFVALLTERLDSEVDSIGGALIEAAPAVARLRGMIEADQVEAGLDPSGPIVAAVRRIHDIRRNGRLSLAEALDQQDMLGGPDAAERAMLDLLLRRPGRETLGGLRQDDILERVQDYAARAESAPREPDMFGTPPPGFPEVMGATLRAARLDARADLATATGGAAEAAPVARPIFDDANPQEIDPADLPGPTAPAGDSGAALAVEQGFDMDPAAEIEALRLADAGALPEELAALLQETRAMDDKLQNAAETWQAAAACAIRGG